MRQLFRVFSSAQRVFTIAGMAELKPFDFALYLMGEFTHYVESRTDELAPNELASLQERLARFLLRLQGVLDQREASERHPAGARKVR